jgi:hypothetical protein
MDKSAVHLDRLENTRYEHSYDIGPASAHSVGSLNNPLSDDWQVMRADFKEAI